MKYIDIINKSTAILKKKNLEENVAYKLLFFVDKNINSIIDFTYIRNEKMSQIKVIKYFFFLFEYIFFQKPLSYITNSAYFFNNEFIVLNSIHTPRVESEILINKANELILKNGYLHVLDLCCGTGNLGISILLCNPKINLTLSDINKKAIKNTQKNLKKYNLTADIICSNLFKKINDKYDLIICNPPYIKKGDKNIDFSVKLYEDKKALYAKNNGLFFYENIMENIQNFITKNGVLILEIGFNQANDVISIIKKNKNVKDCEVLKDQFFNDRGIIVYF